MVAAVAPTRTRSSFFSNGITAIVVAAVGYVLVMYVLGSGSAQLTGPLASIGFSPNAVMLLAYVVAVILYLTVLGFFSYPIRWLLGSTESQETQFYRYGVGDGWRKYLRLTYDHKVIGVQYLFTVLLFFCIGGFNAMLIRLELTGSSAHYFSPQTYLNLVGEHSVMMLIMASSIIIGPFGNYFIPLMIGAKRMAHPRIESLSFWLFLASGLVLLTAIFYDGFPTGWTGYSPLADQAHLGMDSYIIAFALAGAGGVASAINILATVLFMRAPGMTWSRITATIWAIVVASILAWLAFPILIGTLTMVAFDRSFFTGFFIPAWGGSAFLYENLFWTFGHPEVYILAVPAFGVILDIIAVFTRKPVFGYKASVVSMFGIGLLSWFVWQHHLFVSGLTPGLRPFFMFSTEMISFPTGIIFLSALGTMFLGRIRYTVPMLFALAFLPNFLLGGISGVFLSDVPADIQLHGSYFVQAHFHFVLMGGTLFAFFAAVYYWLPKLTGRTFNNVLGHVHFWTMWIGFNGTFITLAIVGLLGMPRRVPYYAPYLHTTNFIASVFAFILGASIFPFLANLVYGVVWGPKVNENPWESRSLEWMTSTPPPIENFDEIPQVVAGPYGYGVTPSRPMAVLKPSESATGLAGAGAE
jgi:cytochrome c oxidase subunit 1